MRDLDANLHVKALGRAIGAARRTAGRVNAPVDGDGDGFYSPRAGLPDKTPVPAAPRLGLDSLARRRQAPKQMIDAVTKKFGPIDTADQAREALKKAFPKMRIDDAYFEKMDKLTVERRGQVLGLLYGSIRNPKAARDLKVLTYQGDVGKDPRYKACVTWSDTVHGSGLRMDFHPNAQEAKTRVSRRILAAADPNDRVLLQNMFYATHEFAHVEHMSRIFQSEDFDVNSPFDAMPKMLGMKTAAVEREYLDIFDQLTKGRDDLRRLLPDVIAQKPEEYSDEALARQARVAVMNKYRTQIWAAMWYLGHDGLSAREIAEADRAYAANSDYGATNVFEGVAEAITARVMEGAEFTDGAGKLLDWVNTKAAAAPKETVGDKNDAFDIVLCGGLIEPPRTMDANTRVKALGRTIGRAARAVTPNVGGKPDDGDGDGFYSPKPGMPDKTPVPVQVGKPDWENIEDIIDWSVFGLDDDEIEDSLYEFHDEAVGDWGQWDHCRDMRKVAYRLAGIEPGGADPNLDRQGGYFGNGFRRAKGDAEQTEHARYFMAALVNGARGGGDSDTLYRAMDIGGKDREAFDREVTPGAMLDIPLLSFADQRGHGPDEFLSKFGSDVLFEVEKGAASVQAGHFDPMYNERNERDFLDEVESFIQTLMMEIDDIDPNDAEEAVYRESLQDRVDELTLALEKYRAKVGGDTADWDEVREDLKMALSDSGFEQPQRFAGTAISEDDADFADVIYEPEYNTENVAYERISGGRFEVVAVDTDPKGVYGQVVRLRQVGVFDPQQPGRLVPVQKEA